MKQILAALAIGMAVGILFILALGSIPPNPPPSKGRVCVEGKRFNRYHGVPISVVEDGKRRFYNRKEDE